MVADHAGTERAPHDSGPRWTTPRNNLHMHMQVPVVERAVASGRSVTSGCTGAVAHVTREDRAVAAAAVPTRDGHEDTVYDVIGPEAPSGADLVALARDIGGRCVEFVGVDDDASTDGLRTAGPPAGVAKPVTSFGAAVCAGFPANVGSTGHRPTAPADVVRAPPKSRPQGPRRTARRDRHPQTRRAADRGNEDRHRNESPPTRRPPAAPQGGSE
ncbi:hypothetical protein EHYA_08433 [Embleya hyalina]|uniref:Uncharacterized protein n=1 Tax=Embleya hyalina TaxID=516124 RepID=A0A401Z1I9_9ACTN|nr:hypothetical protein EHYA_08433 [Embleya hyalina]